MAVNYELLKTNIKLSNKSETLKAKQMRFIELIETQSNKDNLLFCTMEENVQSLHTLAKLYKEITNRDDLSLVANLVVRKEDIPNMIKDVTNNYQNWEILVPMMAGVETTKDEFFLTDKTHKYLKNINVEDIISLYEQMAKITEHTFCLEEKLQNRILRANERMRNSKEKNPQQKTIGKSITR